MSMEAMIGFNPQSIDISLLLAVIALGMAFVFYLRFTKLRRALTSILFSGASSPTIRQLIDEVESLVSARSAQRRKILGAVNLSADAESLEDCIQQALAEIILITGASISAVQVAFDDTELFLSSDGFDPDAKKLLEVWLQSASVNDMTATAGSTLFLQRFGIQDVIVERKQNGHTTVVLFIGSPYRARIDRSAISFLMDRFVARIKGFIDQRRSDDGGHSRELLQQISHDIRSPLNNVKSALQLAQQVSPSTENDCAVRETYLSVALQNVESVAELTETILDYSSRAAGIGLRSQPVTVNLFSVIKETLDRFSVMAALKGIIPSVHVDQNIHVQFDPQQLRRVLANIMSNAIKYSNQGSITIRANLSNAVPQGATVALTISDQGIGMTQSELSQLFSPFTRFQRHLADGAGLGLVVTRQLVEANKSTISVESTYGAGTCFRLELPMSTVVKETVQTPIKILYIEDSEDTRSAFVRMIQNDETTVITAHNFIEAESIIRFQSVDGVICDFNTGKGDFDSFQTSIVKHLGASVAQALPMLIVSGQKFKADRFSTDRIKTLTKPANFIDIRDWLSNVQTQVRLRIAGQCSGATGIALSS